MLAVRKEIAMASNVKIYKSVAFEDGSYTVVITDAANPRVMEVVATFYDAERAKGYADRANEEVSKPQPQAPASEAAPKAPTSKRVAENVEPQAVASDVSARQAAVLDALRDKMDDNKLVETKAAALAGAAQIPLGSLHFVLQSLEKKQLITTTRPASARAPAVYQVL